MITLARHELYRLFASPFAWLVLALTQLILAYLFLSHVDYFLQVQGKIAAIPGAPGVTQLVATTLFSDTAIILLIITPLITMRLLAEEFRNDSFPLLLSAPLSATQIVLGKYLGALGFFVILLSITQLMPLSLSVATELDYYALFAGLGGLFLLVASFTAIGLFLSSLTQHPAVAAMTTFSVLFLLWIIDWAGNTAQDSWLSWLSLLSHFSGIIQGDIHSQDIAYYLIIIALFLALTIHKLNDQRLN